MEKTLVLLKPDCVARRLCGQVIDRLERAGLTITAAKVEQFSRALIEEHYAEHRGKEHFAGTVAFMTSGPCWALLVEGENAIAHVRALSGTTNPAQAAPGTIRGDLGGELPNNLIHASDSPASAERERALFFDISK